MRFASKLGLEPRLVPLWAGVLLLSGPWSTARAESEGTSTEGTAVVMRSRQPIAVHFAAPVGARLKVRRADVLAHFDDLMQRHTDLVREDVKDADTCQGEIHCFVLRARTDYGENKVEPEAQEKSKEKVPHLLFLISSIAQDGEEPDRVSALLVDADLALELYSSANRDKEYWKEDLEARIGSEAVLGRVREAKVATSEDARLLLERVIRQEFRSALERFGNWEPFGKIELSMPQAGLEIVVDGVTVGTTRSGITMIEQVPQGTRKLRLQSPEYDPYETQLIIQQGAIERLEPKVSRASGMGLTGRTIVLLSGAAVALAGSVVTVLAVAAQNNDLQILCVNPAEGQCGSARWLKTGFDSSITSGDPNADGLLYAPLGYSLIATGATVSLGSLFFTDEEEFPWIPIVAGVALGFASYGISAALDGSSPFPEQ